MRKIFFLVFMLVLVSTYSIAMPDLKLPYNEGVSLILTRGYYDSSNPTATTHQNYGTWADDRFALDFVGNGCDSWQSPILSVADGTIVSANYSSGYGNNIVIDHGDGYRTRYSHLDSMSVNNGQSIVQGQQIGKMGNTGNVSGTACPTYPGTHLHFAMYLNGYGVKPEPMSNYYNFTEGNSYTSNNHIGKIQAVTPGLYSDGFHSDGTSQAFLETYEKYKNIIGVPYDNGGGVFVHEYKGITDKSFSVWIQDFYNYGTDKHYALFLNDVESPMKVYLLQRVFNK